MIRKALLAGALGLALTTAGAVTVDAKKADEVIRYHDDDAGEDGFLTFFCDYPVEFSVDAKGTVRLFDDGRVHATEHGTFTISAKGRTLTRSWAGLFKGQSSETVDVDAGTITIMFNDTNYGKHEKWTGDDGGVLVMDRGRANFVGTVVLDLDTYDFISLEETITTNGPHPILEQGGLGPQAACDYFNG